MDRTDLRAVSLRRTLARIGIVVVALALGLATAFTVITLTRPSDDELQRAALEELGLPADWESSALVGPVLDDLTERISDRVVSESRTSAAAGAGAGVLVAVGVALALDRRW